jgi:hypothetical protein
VPRQKRRILLKQLVQSFGLVVVDGSFGLGGRPFQALALLAENHGAKVLPARETVFSRQHELRVPQR